MVLPSKNYKPHCFVGQVNKYYQAENTDRFDLEIVTPQETRDKYSIMYLQVETTNYIVFVKC